MQRITGLDGIRFVCALVVVLFHGTSPPILAHLTRETLLERLALGLYDAAFDGQAAVIVFFVVSGFCIHFPYASGKTFKATPFLMGRGIRILVPTAAYLLLLQLSSVRDPAATNILWSVWCELIYYFLYPGLRQLFQKTSVFAVLMASYAGAAGAACYAAYFSTSEWPGLFCAGGGSLTWLAGLPCWLLGCKLAEEMLTSKDSPLVSAATLRRFRIGAYGLAFLAYLAMLRAHVPFFLSLHIFALFTYYWLRAELRWHQLHPANRILELLGTFSFSLYLTHVISKHMWDSVFTAHGMTMWAGELCFILIIAYCFHLLVERPSHRLARLASRPTPQPPSAPNTSIKLQSP